MKEWAKTHLLTHSRSISVFLLIFLLVVPLLAYSPAINGGFIWDDDDYVVENQTLRSVNGLRQIWLSPQSSPQYYPLVFTSFWLEYHLWGLNPLGYHVVNVLLHIGAALLLWRILTGLGVPGAWLAAALFVLHPVHVESVAWITERKNVLSLVFYFLSALCMISWLQLKAGQGDDRSGRPHYAAGILFFVCALLSKTVTCSLPAALLLLIWWKRDRISRSEILALLPFFILGMAAGLSTAWLEQHHVGAQGLDWDFRFLERILIAGRVIWFYAGKLILPVDLMFNYPRWQIDTTQWWQYLYPFTAVLAIAVLWRFRHRAGNGPLIAVLFFCGTLFPALGFIDVFPFRYAFAADHFQYHASIGLITLFAAATTVGMRRFAMPLKVPVISALLLICCGLTFHQGFDYKDLETLWRNTIAKNPGSWMAHNNLGEVMANQGLILHAKKHFRKAIELKPQYAEPYSNLGSLCMHSGQLESGLDYHQKAFELAPENPIVTYNYGNALMVKGNFSKAIDLFSRTVQAYPDDAQAHNNLGLACMRNGNLQKAGRHFDRALLLNPDYLQALGNKGTLELMEGRYTSAVKTFKRALRLKPDSGRLHVDLIRAYWSMGDRGSAVEQLRTLRRINSNVAFHLAQRLGVEL